MNLTHRSGSIFGEARAKKRNAVAVGEIHHTDAPSHPVFMMIQQGSTAQLSAQNSTLGRFFQPPLNIAVIAFFPKCDIL